MAGSRAANMFKMSEIHEIPFTASGNVQLQEAAATVDLSESDSS